MKKTLNIQNSSSIINICVTTFHMSIFSVCLVNLFNKQKNIWFFWTNFYRIIKYWNFNWLDVFVSSLRCLQLSRQVDIQTINSAFHQNLLLKKSIGKFFFGFNKIFFPTKTKIHLLFFPKILWSIFIDYQVCMYIWYIHLHNL